MSSIACGPAGSDGRAGASSRPRIAGQGALLALGAATGQLMSFARNALLGHLLSRDDFGIAAGLAITLQMLEMLSDVAVDRMIVRAPEGDDPRMQATGQTLLVARGFLVGLVLVAIAPLAADYFSAPQAAFAFAMLGAVALARGLMHLDVRRAQRRLENMPVVAMETIPQALALAATWPVVMLVGDFSAVVWLAILQVVAASAISHLMASRGYRLGWELVSAKAFLRFGWPILLSAVPLVAVFQGDRLVVARNFDLGELGAYSAAFMLTMVPSVLMAKVGLSLLLPVFASQLDDGERMRRTLALWMEISGALALAYLAAFWIAGGSLLRLSFGANFAGQGAVVGALAAMWALRMLQVVPGALLMAQGRTLATLVAGTVRAGAIGLAIIVAVAGGTLAQVAATGIVGEVASILVVHFWLARGGHRSLAATFTSRAVFFSSVAVVIVLGADSFPLVVGDMVRVGIGGLVAGVLMLAVAVKLWWRAEPKATAIA